MPGVIPVRLAGAVGRGHVREGEEADLRAIPVSGERVNGDACGERTG